MTNIERIRVKNSFSKYGLAVGLLIVLQLIGTIIIAFNTAASGYQSFSSLLGEKSFFMGDSTLYYSTLGSLSHIDKYSNFFNFYHYGIGLLSTLHFIVLVSCYIKRRSKYIVPALAVQGAITLLFIFCFLTEVVLQTVSPLMTFILIAFSSGLSWFAYLIYAAEIITTAIFLWGEYKRFSTSA